MNLNESQSESENPNDGTDAHGAEQHQENDEGSVTQRPGFRVRTRIRAGHEVGVIE